MELIIKYNGKKYWDFKDAVNEAIIDGIKDHFKKELNPFKKELADYNAEVTINIPKDFKNANIEITNIPEDLKGKIIKTLQ